MVKYRYGGSIWKAKPAKIWVWEMLSETKASNLRPNGKQALAVQRVDSGFQLEEATCAKVLSETRQQIPLEINSISLWLASSVSDMK